MKQQVAVQAVLAAAISCPEVKAVFLKGSLAKGISDEHSDVDFYCLVDSERLGSFLNKRLSLLEQYRPVIYHSESNFVGPQAVAVFDDGLHFDLYTVTEETFPLVGAFQVLHDPDQLLGKFSHLTKDHSISADQLVTTFSEFSFTLLEFLAAWQRQDLVWAHRLTSHLAGDLGVVLRFLYDPSNARLGSKRLEQVLPESTKHELRSALLESGHNLPNAVLALSRLLQDAMLELEAEQALKLDWRLFHLMLAKITKCSLPDPSANDRQHFR